MTRTSYMTETMKLVMVLVFSVGLGACSGGSVTGRGTSNSPFVGTYKGSTAISVSVEDGSQTVQDSVSIFVHRDGLVQFGDASSTIFASTPLRNSEVGFDGAASALVDPQCGGTISLSGTFSPADNAGASFEGTWSSSSASCFGTAGTVSGPITATRVNSDARASRVFETNSSALLRAFRKAID